jgi:hypothetical protein
MGEEKSFARRPQRKLFGILLAIYFIWIGVLLVMYFKTVRPQRLQRHEVPLDLLPPPASAP